MKLISLLFLCFSLLTPKILWADDDYWLPNKLAQFDTEIIRYLDTQQRSDEVIDLNFEELDFPGFYLPQRTRSPQGAVLILPDNGEHGQWPGVVGPLRDTLPDSGWSTLAINLPNIPARTFPIGPTDPTGTPPVEENGSNEIADDSDSEPDEADINSENPAELYQQMMLQRISAAIHYLQNRGQLNIAIVAHGHSAIWAALWLEESELGKSGIGLILVDATEDSYAPERLQQILPQLALPIFDIITQSNKNSAFINTKRKGAILNKQHSSYQQLSSSDPVRRIRGWLKKNMAGEERKVKPNAPTGGAQPTNNG